MRKVAIFASFIATAISFAWLIQKPGYDSAVAFAAGVSGVLASLFLKRETTASGQTQSISQSSIGIQAGRDANMRDINR